MWGEGLLMRIVNRYQKSNTEDGLRTRRLAQVRIELLRKICCLKMEA